MIPNRSPRKIRVMITTFRDGLQSSFGGKVRLEENDAQILLDDTVLPAALVKDLNGRDDVDGILVQLPLPAERPGR